MWIPTEANLGELILLFHRADPWYQTQVIRLGDKCLYPMNYVIHLTIKILIKRYYYYLTSLQKSTKL